MKIKSFFTAMVVVFALFSCTNEDDSVVPDKGSKSISVSLAGMQGIHSKATEPGSLLTKDTMNVNSVLINLTDASGSVIKTQTITKDATAGSDWDKLTTPGKGLKFINVPKAVAKVYVYGNPGSSVVNNRITTTLDQQQGSEVLYFGLDEELTPVTSEPVDPDPTSGQTYTAYITIKPIVARLQITSIRIKNSGSLTFSRVINGSPREATVTWDSFSADLKGVYLNNFYNTYHDSTAVTDLYYNTSAANSILLGQWLFNQPTAVDAASYASYSNYVGGNYENLPVALPENRCYAFNIFPGDQIPQIHFDLANLSIGNLTTTDPAVFNPVLAQAARFANIVKYFNSSNVEMVAADFKPGTLYNMAIELLPTQDNDLKNTQYNVLVHVTVAPWTEETITPGFDLNQ